MKKLLGILVLGLLNVLKVIAIMVTELSHGQMEQNTLVNLKMVYNTDKELLRIQMEVLLKVSGKTAN